MPDPKILCTACGKSFWRAQRWQHEKCVAEVVNKPVVNEQVVNEPVVNSAIEDVPKLRTADRHKKTPERAAYQREHMRNRRRKD